MTDIAYGSVPSSDVDVAPPAGAKVVDLGSGQRCDTRPEHAGRHGLDAVKAAADFPVVAPDSLVGLPRQDVRLVGGDRPPSSSTGRASAGSRSSSARPTRPAPGGSQLSGLPAVSLDGADRARARHAARNRARVAARRGRLRPRRLAAACRRRGGRAGRRSDRRAPGRGARARQALRRDRRRRPRRPDRRARRRVRLPRPERRRQDDVAAHAARPDPADRGLGAPLRPRPARSTARRRSTASPASSRARASTRTCRAARTCACSPTTTTRRPARGSTRCSRSSSCATAPRIASAATRTACASGSGIAASLLRSPRLLLLDEPTTGLDPAGMRDMRDLVRRLASEGITVLLSSHLLPRSRSSATGSRSSARARIVYEGELERPARHARRAACGCAPSSPSGRGRSC